MIDTQFRVNLYSKVHRILGKSFLATANAIINCRNGLMNITFRNMTLEVNIFYVGRKPQVDEVSNCDIPTLVSTLEEEEFEPLHVPLMILMLMLIVHITMPVMFFLVVMTHSWKV